MFLAVIMIYQIIPSFADDDVLITWSSDMAELTFDGKWTHMTEWKRSSLNEIKFENGGKIFLRSAHYENSIYFFIDFISDTTYDKGADRSTICLDKNPTRKSIPTKDSYCFISILDGKSGFSLQGGSVSALSNHFQKIPNHKDLILIGSFSDINDRYSKAPHASYEFKIPTDVVGRSSEYGIFVSVFDASKNKLYTWPNIEDGNPFSIAKPNEWERMVSIDKSLPEFNFPIITIAIVLSASIVIMKFNRLLIKT